MVVDQHPMRRHRWGLGAFVAVAAVYLASSLPLAFLFGATGPEHVSMILVGVGVPSLLAAALAVVITRARGNGPRRELRLQWS